MNKKIFYCIISVTVAMFILSCAESPTGRKQILLYSDAQVNAMGEQAFAGMKSELKISNRRIENSLVQCIARNITAQLPNSVFSGEWEVVVFDDPQVNAFALPGGKIGVYTGLLQVAETQDQIAAVIGHEVGHVIAKHGNARMSQSTVINMGTQAVGQILQANEVAQTPAIMQALGVGFQFGSLAYSRGDESEADIIGLDLMARAGFKPSAAIDLWRNMEAQGGQRPPEFMSTHPSASTRISTLQANLPGANALYKQAQKKANCA